MLRARPLNKKKDEETLFNKAAGPCQATVSPQGLPEMRETQRDREREDTETSREVWGVRWQKRERKESDCMGKKGQEREVVEGFEGRGRQIHVSLQ